jgi:hypothetical protein
VTQVLALLDKAPLSREDTPLVVDRTGVGAAITDMFTEADVRPRAITIHGGDSMTEPVKPGEKCASGPCAAKVALQERR